MSQTEHKNINKIVTISAAVLALILLLLYMQGSFVSKVSPGLSPQASDSNTPKGQTAIVEKNNKTDITSSNVRLLADEERVEEIARMLGGVTITANTLAHAKEMLSTGVK